MAECITVCIAAKFGRDLTPEAQEAWQKFLSVVVSALGRQYHWALKYGVAVQVFSKYLLRVETVSKSAQNKTQIKANSVCVFL